MDIGQDDIFKDIETYDNAFVEDTEIEFIDPDIPIEVAEGSRKEKKKSIGARLFETYTKVWVSILMIVAIMDLQLSYFLAYMGREQIAETLSVAIVTEIIGVMATYIIRAYLESKSMAADELEHKKLDVYGMLGSSASSIDDIDDEESEDTDDDDFDIDEDLDEEEADG